MCPSNKGMQFQTKCGISNLALRVSYYDSQEFVSCNSLIFFTLRTLLLALFFRGLRLVVQQACVFLY